MFLVSYLSRLPQALTALITPATALTKIMNALSKLGIKEQIQVFGEFKENLALAILRHESKVFVFGLGTR